MDTRLSWPTWRKMAIQVSGTNWRRKIFFFKFFPSKAEEEACKVNNTPWVPTQELVEEGPALTYDWHNPWKIKKKITHEHLNQGELVISYSDTFDYILPYFELDKANQLVKGSVMGVRVFDVTNFAELYQYQEFTFKKRDDGDYSLSIKRLFEVRGLGIDDEIGICWNPISQAFMFYLLSRVWRKKTFSYNIVRSVTRELIETGPTGRIRLNTIIRCIRKTITSEDFTFGELRITFFLMFECILPYWKLEMARTLVDGNVVPVNLWDLTQQNAINKYEGGGFTLRKLPNDDYSLSFMRLINDRGLGVGDVIGLHWNPLVSKFIFKLISKVCGQTIRPVFIRK